MNSTIEHKIEHLSMRTRLPRQIFTAAVDIGLRAGEVETDAPISIAINSLSDRGQKIFELADIVGMQEALPRTKLTSAAAQEALEVAESVAAAVQEARSGRVH